LRRQGIEPAVPVEGVVERKRGDFRTGRDQRIDHVRVDETVGAGDHDLALLIAHGVRLRGIISLTQQH
jgi:hypothetical protein